MKPLHIDRATLSGNVTIKLEDYNDLLNEIELLQKFKSESDKIVLSIDFYNRTLITRDSALIQLGKQIKKMEDEINRLKNKRSFWSTLFS